MSNVKHLDKNSTIEYLETALTKAKMGDLTEVTIIGRHRDGTTWVCSSGSDNSHEMAGKILDAAILRLGYALR